MHCSAIINFKCQNSFLKLGPGAIYCHQIVQLTKTNMKSCFSTLFSGLPQSGKNIWKMKFFPGQGKVREFCGWPGKFRKDLKSQGKVRGANSFLRE